MESTQTPSYPLEEQHTLPSPFMDSDHRRKYPVLRILDVAKIPHAAVSIRNKQYDTNFCATDCTITDFALHGSFNVLFPLTFSDGEKWIIKFPGQGHPDQYDDSDAQALRSEAFTMQWIRRETNIPVPEVHAFDGSFDNELGCPYILMEYLDGVPLHKTRQWFDPTATDTVLDERRTRILDKIAESVVQLDWIRFPRGGQLSFDDSGSFQGIGGFKRIDGQAATKNLFIKNRNDHLPEVQVFPESFKDPKAYMLCMLNDQICTQDTSNTATDAFLRLFIDWLFEGYTTPTFILSHPDLDLQNIIVSTDGELTGLIDWDGVETVPLIFGYARYPKMLTVDWHHLRYKYKEGKPDPHTLSPEQLARYQEIYHHSRQKYHARLIQKCHDTSPRLNSMNLGNWTAKRSLVLDLLWTAANDGTRKLNIMCRLFDELTGSWDRMNVQVPSQGPHLSDQEKTETSKAIRIGSNDAAGSICYETCSEEDGIKPDLKPDCAPVTAHNTYLRNLSFVGVVRRISQTSAMYFLRCLRLVHFLLGVTLPHNCKILDGSSLLNSLHDTDFGETSSTETSKIAEGEGNSRQDDEEEGSDASKDEDEDSSEISDYEPPRTWTDEDLFEELLKEQPELYRDYWNYEGIGLALAENKIMDRHMEMLREGFEALCA